MHAGGRKTVNAGLIAFDVLDVIRRIIRDSGQKGFLNLFIHSQLLHQSNCEFVGLC